MAKPRASANRITTIELPKVCGFYSFEELMRSQHFGRITHASSLTLDLRTLQWIGPLQISLLFELIQRFREQDAVVVLNVGTSGAPSGGLQLLTQIGFFSEFTRLGGMIDGTIPTPRSRQMGAFRHWLTRDEFDAYLESLSAPGITIEHFGGGDTSELVQSGEFRDILLRELGDNGFRHGGGRAVRYVVSERGPRERQDHGGYLAFFGGRPVLEVAVSDSGPGLVEKLSLNCPNEWQPNYAKLASAVSAGARVCAYALEFSSTSDRAGRRAALDRMLDRGSDFEGIVPTGLFHVASLVRHYGGQLIVRTETNCVSFDFSEPEHVSLKENPIGAQGADFRGTHILIRVPKDAKGIVRSAQHAPVATQQLTTRPTAALSLSNLWKDCKNEPGAFIQHCQDRIETELASKYGTHNSLLALVADGLSADTKVISLLLTWLGTIPRRGWQIAVFGARTETFQSALQQSGTIATLRQQGSATFGSRILSWAPFLLTSVGSSHALIFGDSGLPSDLQTNAAAAHTTALQFILRDMLNSPPVRHIEHSSRYYLIEQKYYTQQFFEIGQLVSAVLNPTGSELAFAHLVQWLRQHNVGTVFAIAEPLLDFARRLSVLLMGSISCYPSSELRPNFLEAIRTHPRGKRFVILSDVVCTGKQFKAFFDMCPFMEDLLIFTFVDGRPGNLPYITAEKSDGANTISVHSYLRTPVQPIEQLPHSPGIIVLRVDNATHAPTSGARPVEGQIDATSLVKAAAASSALFHGHIEFKGKHFVDFLDLPRLFYGLRRDLERSWATMRERIVDHKFSSNEISALYVDEKRGWEYLVKDITGTFGLAECRPLSRADLEAPPVDDEIPLLGACVWFILPAIANGRTVRRCLEYASRLKTRRRDTNGKAFPPIFVSVVVGRMEPAELTFYQYVRKYKGSDVWIDVLASFPLPAYPSAHECPLCRTLEQALGHALRIEEYGRLFRSFNDAYSRLHLQQWDLASPPASIDKDASERGGRAAQLMALFTLGAEDIDSRKRLWAVLSGDGGYAAFIEMVGSHSDAHLFNELHVQRLLHNQYELLQRSAQQQLSQFRSTTVSLRYLLGVHVLFPKLLERDLRSILVRVVDANDRDAISNLIFVALLVPRQYGLQLAIGAHMTEYGRDLEGLLQEIRTCLEWFGSEPRRSILAFETLLRLLRRSGDWGSGLDDIKALPATSNGTAEGVQSRFRKLEISAIEAVLAHVATIEGTRVGQGLWSSIKAEGLNPDPAVRSISDLTDAIRALTKQSYEESREELFELFKSLDTAGQDLARALGRGFSNPQDAIERVKIEAKESSRWTLLRDSGIAIEASVADDQPGILITLNDLVATMNLVLENANELVRQHRDVVMAARPTLWIRFCFEGPSPDGMTAIFTVRDNLPYPGALKPAGGLLQVIEYCNRYGAAYIFDPQFSDDPTAKMRFFFRIDSSRRSDV